MAPAAGIGVAGVRRRARCAVAEVPAVVAMVPSVSLEPDPSNVQSRPVQLKVNAAVGAG